MKTFFHSNVAHMMTKFVKNVMNDRQVLPLIYKKLSYFDLINGFTQIPRNLVVLGTKHVWLVNCATSHPSHFVGTVWCINLGIGKVNNAMWMKFMNFVLRFANPGAIIDVYRLDENKRLLSPLITVSKQANARF